MDLLLLDAPMKKVFVLLDHPDIQAPALTMTIFLNEAHQVQGTDLMKGVLMNFYGRMIEDIDVIDLKIELF